MKKNNIDLWIVFPVAGLILFGGLNIFGIRNDLIPHYVLFSIISVILFIIGNKLGIDFFKENIFLIYLAFVLLFILTMIIGENVRGSKRWIDLYFLNFQTSEFFKPFFLILLAVLLSKKNIFTLRYMSVIFISACIPMLFIFAQPDLGSMILYTGTFIALLFFAGSSPRFMLYLMSLAALIAPIGWFFLKTYQKARIIGFLNPELDPQGITYNINQSIITIGSGGFFGKGLGLGTQARFRFLPEFQTDFAYASLVEQFGFVGGVLVLVLFSILFARIIKKIFENKNEPVYTLYLIGAVVLIALSVFVNVGMNIGILPVTGIALPFISYGGSSIASTMLLLGIASSL